MAEYEPVARGNVTVYREKEKKKPIWPTVLFCFFILLIVIEAMKG